MRPKWLTSLERHKLADLNFASTITDPEPDMDSPLSLSALTFKAALELLRWSGKAFVSIANPGQFS